MAWSTTAPSGVTWSAAVSTGVQKNNYYNYWAEASVARGATNTVYVRIVLLAQLHSWDYRLTAPDIEMRGYINGAGSNGGQDTPATYTAPRPAYGAAVVVKTIYWYGTAAYGSKISVRSSNTSGYSDNAVLTAPNYTTKYTVSYSANGGSGAPASQSKLYGSALTLSSVKPTRAGYTFDRWNTKADGTGTPYAAGGSYTANAAVTLYAIWQINTYAVTYNGNGGTGSTAGQTKTYGVNLTLRDNGFTYSGHVFSHWNTKADDTGTRYNAGATYTGDAALTLYAIWDGTWGVTYDGNGATGGETESQTKVEDISLALRYNGFVRDKYTFVEWNTAADGSGGSYTEGQEYTQNAALVLYAIWLKNNIPVFYNDDGVSRQVEKAYYNDDGVIRECSLYYNDNGAVRPIT